MGTRRFFTFATHFDSVNRGAVSEFLFITVFTGLDYFRVLVSKFLIFVFGSILTYIFSFREDEYYEKNQPGFRDEICSRYYYKDPKENSLEVYDTEHAVEPTGEADCSVSMESSKCQALSKNCICGFIEEPKSLTVQELFLGPSDSSSSIDTEETEESVQSSESECETILNEEEELGETDGEEKVFTEFKFLNNYAVPHQFSEGLSSPADSNSEKVCSNEVDLACDDSSGDGESYDGKSAVIDELVASSDDDECIELKPEFGVSESLEDDLFSLEELFGTEENSEEQDLLCQEKEHNPQMEKFSSVFSETENNQVEDKEQSMDYDDYDDDDEDDDLLEQLKMEIKTARTGGLPTIMEESEPAEMKEDTMKPLKIDEKKLEHKDLIMEIHKFYRKYLDKMRKLDILNSQTMHAINLLQLKESSQMFKFQKTSTPAIKSLLYKTRTRGDDPKLKFIRELHHDFELVYVGQLCLSWEILRWQYRKALELEEYDPQELRWYNKIAAEFQLFQVLLERFIENEPFQGLPRVENYVKNRVVRCNILQVPIIKDDSSKDKKERGGDDKDAITSLVLIKIIEESIRLFWEFLRNDKDGANDTFSRRPELQDSVDSEFFRDVQVDFQKKEKKLKEILRSGSCIVKKFQKHCQDESKRVLFFAQIELKLISRVLNMSKITADQLIWCHEKLVNISFFNRKLVLQPSFLLFPC